MLSGLPLDSHARTVCPQGSSYIFFQRGTKTHYAFLPLLRSKLWGFRKTNRPLKILGARGLGQGFSCVASSIRVGHWGKRKRAALVVWGLPAQPYKELRPFSLPSQCCSEPLEVVGEVLLHIFDCRPNTVPRGVDVSAGHVSSRPCWSGWVGKWFSQHIYTFNWLLAWTGLVCEWRC